MCMPGQALMQGLAPDRWEAAAGDSGGVGDRGSTCLLTY